MRYILMLAGFMIVLSSCVTNKKYVYLQKNDVNKQGLPADTLLREYENMVFDYKIQPEDILSIRFKSLTPSQYDFFEEESSAGGQGLNLQANPLLIGELVDAEGNVPFPVIGKVKVSGLTVYEVQDTLQKIANQYLQSPLVKVRLINFHITLLGEVKKEGTITLANNRVTMLEAIGLAGGLTDFADKKNIKLIRQIDGKSIVLYMDLLDESFMDSPSYFVNQNDVLIVPALRQRPYQVYFGKNLALMISALSLLLLTINLTQQ